MELNLEDHEQENKDKYFVFQMCAGDGLPAQVYERCVQQVNDLFNFKLQCESSDATLRVCKLTGQ